MLVHPALFLLGGIAASYLPVGVWKKRLGLASGFLCLITVLFRPETYIFRVQYLNFELKFLEVAAINRPYAVIFALLGLLSLMYSYIYAGPRLYRRFLFYLISVIMLVHAGDLLTFYLSWELMSLSAFFLISYGFDRRARRAGVYYFLMHVSGGLSLLFGVILQYQAAGTLELQLISHGEPFFIYAILVKLAALGMHFWLPRAYTTAPFTACVFLASITTKAGVYALYRLLGINLIAYIGLFMAMGGVVLALRQDRTRRLLSYSIISQVGYMVAGISYGTTTSILGGNIHVINHILYKALLFMVAGVIIDVTDGRENLARMGRSLGKKIPLTAVSGVIASLAIAGIPPFNGYVSKMVIKSGIDSSLLEYGLLLTGVGTALCFLKFCYYGFFARSSEEIKLKKSVPLLSRIALIATSALVIILGVSFSGYEVFLGTEELFPAVYSPAYLVEGLIPPLLAVFIFVLKPEIISPHITHEVKLYDPYIIGFNRFRALTTRVSSVHDGRIPRYIHWIITGVILYMALILLL